MNDPSIRIKLNNVTKRFGIGDAEISALDNVDLTVKKGEYGSKRLRQNDAA